MSFPLLYINLYELDIESWCLAMFVDQTVDKLVGVSLYFEIDIDCKKFNTSSHYIWISFSSVSGMHS